MADKYISREAALMKLMQDGCSAKNLQSISDMPAADVAEVVHGRWERMRQSETTWRCSACDVMVGAFLAGCSHYCYCCGAKMDGVDNKCL